MTDTSREKAWTDKIIALPVAEIIDGDTLRFERHLDAPPSRVWEAVTTPAGWQWTSGMRADLRVGGAFEIQFDAQNSMQGHITDLELGRRIVMDWAEATTSEDASTPPRVHSQSTLSIELEHDGDGTRLTLTHWHVTREDAPGFGAGWHAHLGQLQAYLVGHLIESDAIYAALLPDYERRVAEAFPAPA